MVRNKEVGIPLTTSDSKNLNDWIRALNTSGTPVKLLRQGVDSIITLLWSAKGNDSAKLSTESLMIHTTLEDRGCNLYRHGESKQTDRITRLVSGASVDFDGRSLEIGNKLQQRNGEDNIYAYTLKNEPRTILITGSNKLAFADAQLSRKSWKKRSPLCSNAWEYVDKWPV